MLLFSEKPENHLILLDSLIAHLIPCLLYVNCDFWSFYFDFTLI
jgi:hypothetical protein